MHRRPRRCRLNRRRRRPWFQRVVRRETRFGFADIHRSGLNHRHRANPADPRAAAAGGFGRRGSAMSFQGLGMPPVRLVGFVSTCAEGTADQRRRWGTAARTPKHSRAKRPPGFCEERDYAADRPMRRSPAWPKPGAWAMPTRIDALTGGILPNRPHGPVSPYSAGLPEKRHMSGANRRRTARKIRTYHFVCLQISKVISSHFSSVSKKSWYTCPTARERYIQMPHSKCR